MACTSASNGKIAFSVNCLFNKCEDGSNLEAVILSLVWHPHYLWRKVKNKTHRIVSDINLSISIYECLMHFFDCRFEVSSAIEWSVLVYWCVCVCV